MIFVCVLLIFILVVSVCIAAYGSKDNSSYDEQAVIVLGYGIKENKLPEMLKNRLDKATEYHTKNPNALIIVSGGRSTETKPSEAAVMEKYLISNGVAADKIIKEDKSRTTVENFKFSAEILNKKFGSNYSAALITNIFHIYRSERYAIAAGIKVNSIGAKTVWYDIPRIYIREVAMIIHMCFTIKRNFSERT